MKPARITALVIGSIVAVAALAAIVSAGLLGAAYFTQREDGYLSATLDDIESDTVAVTTDEIRLRTEPGTPRWVLDAIETDVRLRASPVDGKALFLGVADSADLEAYLAGVGHDEIRDVDRLQARLRTHDGTDVVAAPVDQDFWVASATGTDTDTVELVWEFTEGDWIVALMNADGSPGVEASVDVGIHSDAFAPVAWILLVSGLVLGGLATGLIVFGVLGDRVAGRDEELEPLGPAPLPRGPYPAALEARLDPELSRWQWLVKWVLVIPHAIVLMFLWAAFAVLTVVAFFAILFTGRYPRPLFDFNVGVLRWTWRVGYYAFNGGLGTDRYPPFRLAHDPDYPASFDVEYPERLSRGLVLVKWWLLAIPHYIVVGLLAGSGTGWTDGGGDGVTWGTGGGLLAVLTLIAGVILLFTGHYPKALHELIVGLNRWVYRVVAYTSLMTDRYPPFRLDQGGSEPGPGPDDGPDHPEPTRTELDLPAPEPVGMG